MQLYNVDQIFDKNEMNEIQFTKTFLYNKFIALGLKL